MTKEVEILGITLDRNMNFHTHIKNIFRKTSKTKPLLRISPYLYQGRKVLLNKSLTKYQFNYCTLVTMFCLRESNNFISKVIEGGLRVHIEMKLK